MSALPIGRAEVRREGRSGLLLLAFGTMVAPCVSIADRLDATLVNMRFVKPLDVELAAAAGGHALAVVTVEENVVAGGAGSAVNEVLAAERLALPDAQYRAFPTGSSSTGRARTVSRWRVSTRRASTARSPPSGAACSPPGSSPQRPASSAG